MFHVNEINTAGLEAHILTVSGISFNTNGNGVFLGDIITNSSSQGVLSYTLRSLV